MKKWKIEIKETESGVVIDAPFIPASDEMTALEWAVKEIVAFTAYALAAADIRRLCRGRERADCSRRTRAF